jgi:hypothetical protein
MKGKSKTKAKSKMPGVVVVRITDPNYLLCRVCRCHEHRPCNPPCHWHEQDLCDNCALTVDRLMEWAETARLPSIAALLREFRRAEERRVRELEAGA